MKTRHPLHATNVAVLLVLSAAIAAPLTAQADDLAAIKARGYIRGVVANEKPYGYIDSSGKTIGIGPDIATAVAKRIGMDQIVWSVVSFDGLIPGVKANRFDFQAAEQAIRPERCKQVVFSVPTSSYSANLLVKAGNPKKITSYEDLASRPGTKVSIIAGGIERLLDNYKIPRADRVYLSNNADAIPALVAGRADVYNATELTNFDLAKLSKEVEVAPLTSDPKEADGKPYRNYGGFSFRQEDKELAAAFNAALTEFKKTDEYAAILKTYGLTDASVAAARAASTESLCAGAK